MIRSLKIPFSVTCPRVDVVHDNLNANCQPSKSTYSKTIVNSRPRVGHMVIDSLGVRAE